jgi:hypothetical protein
MNRNGALTVVDEKGRERERYSVVYGAKIRVEDGAAHYRKSDMLAEWDPYTFSILTEVGGTVHFKDLSGRRHDEGRGGRSFRLVAAGGDGIARRQEGLGTVDRNSQQG